MQAHLLQLPVLIDAHCSLGGRQRWPQSYVRKAVILGCRGRCELIHDSQSGWLVDRPPTVGVHA